ncbi:Protein transporter SEC31 [Rhodotorula toruloides]|nr:Protein transporter SEC31 [Rhodotorula toruloides]
MARERHQDGLYPCQTLAELPLELVDLIASLALEMEPSPIHQQRALLRFGRVCKAWRSAVRVRLETEFVVASRKAVMALTLALAEDEGRHRRYGTRRRLRPRKAVIFVPAIGRTAGLGQLLAKLLDQMRALEDLDLRFGNAVLGRFDQFGVALGDALARLVNLRRISIRAAPSSDHPVAARRIVQWMSAWPELQTFDAPNLEWRFDGIESIGASPSIVPLFPPVLRDLHLNMAHYQTFHISLANYLSSPAATQLRRLELRGLSNPPGPGVPVADLLDGIRQVSPRLRDFALTIAVRHLDVDTYPDFTPILHHLSSAETLTFSPALFHECLLLPSLLPFASRNLQSLVLNHDEGFLPTVPDLPANHIFRFLDDLASPPVEHQGRTLDTLIIYRDTHRVWSYETRQEMREKAARLGLKLYLA